MMIALAFAIFLGLQAPSDPQSFGYGLGVCAHLNDLTSKDTAEMKQAGFNMVRTDIPWSEVERQKGTFDFSRYDQIAKNMQRNGLRPLFILDYGNQIYGEQTPRSADGIAAFVRYAVTTARHFAPYHPMWEIWNEPDHHAYWKPTPNAQEYANLAIATAHAIREATPEAKIVALGLTKLDWAYMKTAADAGLLNDIDYVSVHMYRFVRPEAALPDYKQVQQFIASYHPSHPVGILCTEWGYPLTYPGQDIDRQGSYVVRCYLVGLIAGVDATLLYEWNDTPMAPGQTQGHFGLHGPDGRPRPGYNNVAYLSNELKGYRLDGVEPPAGDVYILRFRRGSNVKTVAWTTALDPADMTTVSTPRDPQQSSVTATIDGQNVMLSPIPRVVSSRG